MRKIKIPKIGQYVLLSKYSDNDIHDPWVIGHVELIIISEKNINYKIKEHSRIFGNCFNITKEEAKERFEFAKNECV